jgi:hypothetical protein
VEYQKQYTTLDADAKKDLLQLVNLVQKTNKAGMIPDGINNVVGLVGNVIKSVLDLMTNVVKSLYGDPVGFG